MMIAMILKLVFKYRKLALAAVIALVALLAINYVDNHGEMKAELRAMHASEQQLLVTIEAQKVELEARNRRIARLNERALADAAKAQEQLEQSQDKIRELQEEVEEVQDNLARIRYETLEAIRDDEEMADWVDDTVPSAAWGLLQQAAEGGSGQ